MLLALIDGACAFLINEMGSASWATGRKLVRWPREYAAHAGTPGPRGEHLTTTGITCIRADQPALVSDLGRAREGGIQQTIIGTGCWMWQGVEGLLQGTYWW